MGVSHCTCRPFGGRNSACPLHGIPGCTIESYEYQPPTMYRQPL